MFLPIVLFSGGSIFGALIMAVIASGRPVQSAPPAPGSGRTTRILRRSSWHTHRPTDESVIP